MSTTESSGKTVTEALFARKSGALVKVGEYVPEERRLDSWDELEHGDEIQYVGGRSTWWLTDHPVTFEHGYANAECVRVADIGGYPHDIDEPASDFVEVGGE